MTIHNLQDEPESTLGAKPMELEAAEEEEELPEYGASRSRREEGEESEAGRKIREQDLEQEVRERNPIRGPG
jgi:hypothetical protein